MSTEADRLEGSIPKTNVPAALSEDNEATFSGTARHEDSAQGVNEEAGDEKDLHLIEKVQAGMEVASDLFDEAKSRLAAVAGELGEELQRKNPDSKLDASWQVAEDAFNKTRDIFQEAIESLRSQLEASGEEDRSIIEKTKGLAETGMAISKEKLSAAQQEFEKAASELRERLKTKGEENRMKDDAEQAKLEMMQGAPSS